MLKEIRDRDTKFQFINDLPDVKKDGLKYVAPEIALQAFKDRAVLLKLVEECKQIIIEANQDYKSMHGCTKHQWDVLLSKLESEAGE
jgi:hypothetical protein